MTFDALHSEPVKDAFEDEKPAADPDAWKSLKTDELKLRQSVFDRVVGGGLTTLGDVENWRASRYEKPKVTGIGEAAKQQIDDAFMTFWTRWAEQQKAEAAKPQAPVVALPTPNTESPNQPAGAHGSTAEVVIKSINDTKWTVREIDAAYDMEILTKLQAGDLPTITKVIRTVNEAWICVPVPIGINADYMLLPLMNRTDAIEPDESGYTGGLAIIDGVKCLIGPQSRRILLKA